MVDPNTRQGKRTPVTLKIKFKSETLEQFIERYAVDVSQGGIFIRTKEPLAVGTQMRFEFQLRDASPLIAGEGTVVWTRENDPSRPAIAPGMGVRFDRLADGSQGVLERILSEKAKQAPKRTGAEVTKPPMFADTPTRVAPVPIQEALLGKDARRSRGDSDGGPTPLPNPTPWHSDADEFPEAAFEEQTKVRALDDLIAQSAVDAGTTGASDELAARRTAARVDSTVPDSPDRPSTVNYGAADNDPAPTPPSSPEPTPAMLDVSPSPRDLPAAIAPTEDDEATTLRGVAPTRPPRLSEPPFVARDAVTKVTGMLAVASEPSGPAKLPAARDSSSAGLVVLLFALFAAGAAGAWYFLLREPAKEAVVITNRSGGSAVRSAGSAAVGSQGSAGIGSQGATGVDIGRNGSAAPAITGGTDAGAAVASNGSASPPAELVESVISAGAGAGKAMIEIIGTEQTGPLPFKAKLEKGKAYKARISAPGYAALDVEVVGGTNPLPAKLTAKPRVISVTTEPPGALIFIDNSASGHSTPFEVELTKPQAAKKSVRLLVRKSGYRPIERVISVDKFTEDATQMVFSFSERLVVQVQTNNNTPRPPPSTAATGSGSATGGSDPSPGSASAGSGQSGSTSAGSGSAATAPGSTPGPGSAAGSALKDGPKPGSGSASPAPPPKDGPKPGSGSAKPAPPPKDGAGTTEAEPDFNSDP